MTAPWHEIRWSARRPSRKQIEGSWAGLTWEEQPLDSPAVDEFRKVLLGLVTPDLGGLVVARFRATSYDSALHWFVSRNRFDEYDFFRILVSNPTVRASLGELQIPDNMVDNPDQLLEPLDPERISPLVLDGELAQMVFEGPVYGNGTVTAIQAKALGARVATDLLEQRFDDFRIFRSTAQWTPWFGGIDLNRTYFLIDMPSAEVTMVCFTDED